MTHPLDRSIAFAFFVTIFFTILALVTGIPVVLVLTLLLPIGILVRSVCACKCLQGPRHSLGLGLSRIQGSNPMSSSSPSTPSGSGAPVYPLSAIPGVARNRHYQQQQRLMRRRRRLQRQLVPLTPLESYHLSSACHNNHRFGVCNSLLLFDKSLCLDQLKDMITSRILRKPEFARFTSKLVFRGESVAVMAFD